MANVALRYLPARDVENGNAAFGMIVRALDGQALGRLEGFMIDPAARTLRYFVVDTRRGRRLMRRLLPFVPAWLDAEHRVLHLLTDIPSAGQRSAVAV